MTQERDVLFVVIARGGSRAVPRKNLAVVGGFPLIAYKVLSGRRSRYCRRLILSSDDPEILDVGRRFGAEVPFVRPAVLATDTASSDEVLAHAVDHVVAEGQGARYRAVMLLEAATPFATAMDYDRAVEFMRRSSAGLVVGMAEQKTNPVFVGPMDADGGIGGIIRQMEHLGRLDRQAVGKRYTMNGAYYLLDWEYFARHRKRYAEATRSYGIVMDPLASVEIDEPIDLDWARFLVDRGFIDLAPWR